MRPRSRWLRLAVLFAGACAAACSEAPASYRAPRLVLLYATCTLNADHLSPFAEGVAYTPELQWFANGGLVFERHNTEAGQSGVAFSSILTGTQADHHQIYRHPLVLDPSIFLISEAYAEAGYDTFSWNAHSQIPAANGYAQGIPEANRRWGVIDPRGRAFAGILGRLRRDPEYRAFVVTTFTYTHAPYATDRLDEFLATYPDEARGLSSEEVRAGSALHTKHTLSFSYNHAATVAGLGLSAEDVERLRRAVRAVYASRVFALDRHFGSVVQEIRAAGLLDASLVAFTADHGEVSDRVNARYPWSHAMQLAPEVLRVPLVVRAPSLGVEPGRYAAVTRSIDVFPTLAGLSGIDLGAHPEIQGVDLSAAVRGREPPPPLLAFSHTSVLVRAIAERLFTPIGGLHWGALREAVPDQAVERIWTRVRDGDTVYKRLRIGDGEWRYAAFDLARDPEEQEDRFDAARPEHREMARRLDAYHAHLVRSYRGDEDASLPSAEEQEALRALGYIE